MKNWETKIQMYSRKNKKTISSNNNRKTGRLLKGLSNNQAHKILHKMAKMSNNSNSNLKWASLNSPMKAGMMLDSFKKSKKNRNEANWIL